MTLRGGYAYLHDLSGRAMGRVMFASPVGPGSPLSIGGKEIELDSEIPRHEHLSAQSSLARSTDGSAAAVDAAITNGGSGDGLPALRSPVPAPAPAPEARRLLAQQPPRKKVKREELKSETRYAAAGSSFATQTAFKNPVRDNTVLEQKPRGEPTPRHDPHAPGAVVMKRPAAAPKGKQIVDVVIDPFLGRHLREHQREGVKFMYECVMGLRPYDGEGAILADEMGLGKTLQTITLLWTLLKQNPIYEEKPVVKKALIVCPVTLINNWQKEFRKWLGADRIGVFVADAVKKTRLTDFTMGKSYSVMIIGYERLRNVQEELAKGAPIDIVIADEGHRLKTVQNKSAKAIQTLNTARRVILSGTPIQNDLSEFFAMVDFVNPGILGTLKAFLKEFEGPIVRSRQPNALKKDIEKGEARNEELSALTSMFILRRTADLLSKYLPPKTEYVLFCNPTPTQSHIYRLVLSSPMFQCALGNSESALQLINVLKKLCNSPSLLSPKSGDEKPPALMVSILESLGSKMSRHLTPSASGKIRVLDQLLHVLHTTTDEKVLLISNYTSTLDLLSILLSSLSLPYLRLDGSTQTSKRQSLVDTFNHSPPTICFAFLLSAKAGGVGLNLVGASRLILFDVDWNPATDLQAMARIHRDGQTRHTRIYRFLLKGALEEKIWQRQVTKIGLADSVMNSSSSASSKSKSKSESNSSNNAVHTVHAAAPSVSHFSPEQLRDLFRLDEGAACQTHELLGCPCGGRGERIEDEHTTSPPDSSPRATHKDGQHGDDDDEDDKDGDDEDDDDTPLSLPPPLIKASDLCGKQEPLRGHHRDNNRRRRHHRAQMRSLLQYAHLDPRLLLSYDDDDDHGNDRDVTEVEAVRAQLRARVDDAALFSVLCETGNGIGYLFKRDSSFAGDDDDDDKGVGE